MVEDSPLDILQKVMRKQLANENYDQAVAAAKIAAPYVHGKAPSARPGGDLAEVSDEELEQAGCEFGEDECRD